MLGGHHCFCYCSQPLCSAKNWLLIRSNQILLCFHSSYQITKSLLDALLPRFSKKSKISTYFMTTYQSMENCRKECHRFWLRLRHAVVPILNNWTSASKKTNGMAFIRTLTISTTAFKRTKQNFSGFRQTAMFY